MPVAIDRSRPLNILTVCAEGPRVLTGGLGEAFGQIAGSLAARGHNVVCFTPRYRQSEERIEFPGRPAFTVDVSVRGAIKRAPVFERMSETRQGVRLQYLYEPHYYGGNGIYGNTYFNPDTKMSIFREYKDNGERFAYLSFGAVEAPMTTGWIPDIIHFHDWHTGFVPAAFNHGFGGRYMEDRITATVMTIHNASQYNPTDDRQLDERFLDIFGLPRELYTTQLTEFMGKISMLLAGARMADAVNTVSPTYADEIRTLFPDTMMRYGPQITGAFAEIAGSKPYAGILNECNYTDATLFDHPEVKPLIIGTDSAYGNKQTVKRHVQQHFGLPVNASIPLIGMVARVDRIQKGYDLAIVAAKRLLESGVNAQFLLCGTGDLELMREMNKLRNDFPDNVALINDGKRAFEESFWVFAGSDLFWMPSRFEPCGIAQMKALAYGALPVVFDTGGLHDTIIDIDSDPNNGNGFVFKQYTADSFEEVTRRALVVRTQAHRWEPLVDRAVKIRFTGEASAIAYENLFLDALEHKARRY